MNGRDRGVGCELGLLKHDFFGRRSDCQMITYITLYVERSVCELETGALETKPVVFLKSR